MTVLNNPVAAAAYAALPSHPALAAMLAAMLAAIFDLAQTCNLMGCLSITPSSSGELLVNMQGSDVSSIGSTGGWTSRNIAAMAAAWERQADILTAAGGATTMPHGANSVVGTTLAFK